VHLRHPTIRSDSTKDAIEDIVTVLRALNSHCLAHDRATTGENLEIRHSPSARRDMTSGGGKGAKGGGGGFVEEGAHRAGLSEESLHCNCVVVFLYRLAYICSIERGRRYLSLDRR
jgi:hypothetical protein